MPENNEVLEDDVQNTLEAEPEKTRLTDWDNEPNVSDLSADIQEAAPSRDADIAKVNTYLDNLNVTGKAKINSPHGRSSIVPKLIRKQAEWRYASLTEPFLATSDLFDVAPATFEDKLAARQNGLLLNSQFNNEIAKVRFFDDYVHTAVDEGTVVTRVSWEYEDKVDLVEVIDYEYEPSDDPEIAQMHEQIHEKLALDPNYLTQLDPAVAQAHELTMQYQQPIAPVPVGKHMEEEVTIVRNRPALEVCDYRNLTIDPTCMGDLKKARFIAYTFETSLAELRREGLYSNLDTIHAGENSVLSEPDHAVTGDDTFTFGDEPRKRMVATEYWGFWDITGEGTVEPIVATWIGNTLIRLDRNPYPDQQHPFVLVQYSPIRRSTCGEPDGVLLEDNQKVVGAVTRGMIDIMGRSASGQQGVRKDALDITNKRKFDKGQDYEFNGSINPSEAFYMHKYPEIPQSAQFMLNLQNAEAESLTGVKAFSTGITGDSLGESATGVRSAMDATAKRELAILKRLAEGVKEIGRKIIAMNAEFLSDEEVIRITNDEFVVIRRDELAGKLDIELSISTPEADNAKAQELAFMLQTTGQAMGPEFSQVILEEIARLRKMPDLANRINKFQPQPDPIQEQIKQLEVAKLQAEIEEIKSRTAENYAEAQLDQARVGTESVKQGNLKSDTDLKNLNFVEQESGTLQERELQKAERQAEAQTRMKQVEHSLKNGGQAGNPTTTNGVQSV